DEFESARLEHALQVALVPSEQHGAPGGATSLQPGGEELLRGDVEAVERLVEDGKGQLQPERERERELLSHAARVRAGVLVEARLQAERAQPLQRAGVGVGPAVQDGVETGVLTEGEVLVQRWVVGR